MGAAFMFPRVNSEMTRCAKVTLDSAIVGELLVENGAER